MVSTAVIVAESTAKELDQRYNSDTNDNGANAEESDAEEEEEDDEDEGGTYKFRFEGDMNPLDFIEDDAFSVQPYQRFERLEHEYEALAAKKRKALAGSTLASQMPVKKFRQDNVLEASFEEICESMYGRRRRSRKAKKKGRQRGSKNKVSPEVTRKLGDANLHYVHGRFEELCRELGNSGQANFCLERAISAEPEDVSLRLEQAELYHEVGEYKKAAESYEQISRLCTENVGALLRATEAMFSVLHTEHTHDHPQLFIEVGDALVGFENYDHAFNYYMMLEIHAGYNSNQCLTRTLIKLHHRGG